MPNDNLLLYIRPTQPASKKPVEDELTAKMRALLAVAQKGTCWRGWHTCVCGEHSTTYDLVLPDGTITNSLAVHYLAYHRDEVPESEIDKLNRIDTTSVAVRG